MCAPPHDCRRQHHTATHASEDSERSICVCVIPTMFDQVLDKPVVMTERSEREAGR
jgi:hypothetical protein